MPCDQVRLAQLQIPNLNQTPASAAALKEAIDHLEGWKIVSNSKERMDIRTPRGPISLDFQSGTMTVEQGNEDLRDQLLVGYGHAAVRALGKRYGWVASAQGNRVTLRR